MGTLLAFETAFAKLLCTFDFSFWWMFYIATEFQLSVISTSATKVPARVFV